MDNYKGKSEINQDSSDNDQANKIDLELKLGQSAYDKQDEEEVSSKGVHDFSSMEGQSSYNMGNYAMAGGEAAGMQEYNNALIWGSHEVGGGQANYMLYQAAPLPALHMINLPNQNRKRANADNGKVCRACGSDNTPLWRKGPDGPQTLCNACGLRHLRTVKKGGE